MRIALILSITLIVLGAFITVIVLNAGVGAGGISGPASWPWHYIVLTFGCIALGVAWGWGGWAARKDKPVASKGIFYGLTGLAIGYAVLSALVPQSIIENQASVANTSFINWFAGLGGSTNIGGYLIGVAATLATAWLVIALVSRFVTRSPP